MRKTVRVDVPVKSPDEFSTLAKRIVAKCKELGTDCPIKKELVNLLDELSKAEEESRTKGQKLHAEAQAATLDAETTRGVAPGQNVNTPNTMYNAVTIVRDTLLLDNIGHEENLSEYGFKVVVGTAKGPKKSS